MQFGRNAIDAALDRCYPTELDHRMGMQPAAGEEFPPLAEVVAFAVTDPVPHWHYISYGLTELGPKQSEDPERSGWGFELTMRVGGDVGGRPPVWPIQFLRWIAMTVWRDGEALGSGHSFLLPKGMLEHQRPEIEALGFVVDDTLGKLATINGKMTFLQVVDLHVDEYRLISRWNIDEVFAAIKTLAPRFVWGPSRESVLRGPNGGELRARADREGSSQQVQFTARLDWNDDVIFLDPFNCHIVANSLQYRVGYGREVTIYSGPKVLELRPGERSHALAPNHARVCVPPDEAKGAAAALRNRNSWLPFECIAGQEPPAGLFP